MSEKNVEIVRDGILAANRGLDAMTAYVDQVASPDVEFRAAGRLPDSGGALRGPEAVKEWYARLFETFDFHIEEEELIDADDAVVLVARQLARSSGSGIEISNRVVVLFRFSEGKVTFVGAYWTKKEALEAAGLSE